MSESTKDVVQESSTIIPDPVIVPNQVQSDQASSAEPPSINPVPPDQTIFERIQSIINTILTVNVASQATAQVNPVDANKYIISLNKESNVIFLSITTLVLGIIYILIIYLASFMFIPINTITTESNMFGSLIVNPESSIGVFNAFVKSKMQDGFSNITENSTIQQFIINLNVIFLRIQTNIQYWFHRFLLFFYIKKNTIQTTKKLNQVSFMDIKY